MNSFDVIISPKALSQLNSYVDYLQYTLLNDQAARNVWQDAMETRDQLSKATEGPKLCSYPLLKKNEYGVIHFMRHRYLMLYRIEGSTIYVDAIYHQLQDYENIFADE